MKPTLYLLTAMTSVMIMTLTVGCSPDASGSGGSGGTSGCGAPSQSSAPKK